MLPYTLDVNVPPKPLMRGHLDLGGIGPKGEISVNSFFVELDGKPFFPIVGEFHYSRYPAADWEEELRKLKAGGLNIVAAYIFWNIHERQEGHFDWKGNLDLRRFVKLAEKAGLWVIIRVGPFDHGEIRNGGIPDWLYGRPFEVRSNDPGYLAYVEKLYAEIGNQVKGQFFKDGGPIIGVQLENEFQHSAAPWEIRYAGSPRELTVSEQDAGVTHVQISTKIIENQHVEYGRDHMSNLKLMAKRHGLDAPLYTATGWGNAAIVPNGSLPVTAAYSYPYWANESSPSSFYLFTDLQKTPDYPPASYDTQAYPVLAAELGVGMNQVYARRSWIPEESVEPMMVRMLGSGANGLGYYMYHGGATPVFEQFQYYNEDASGLPKINYDYQSPIGQYGQVRSHFKSLRLLHLFLSSYGERLAPCPSILPPNHSQTAADRTDVLRYAARAANGSGFLFLSNFQDHADTQDFSELRLEVSDGKRAIPIPSNGTMTLKSGATAILPINLDLGGTLLRSATVQPLHILDGAHTRHYVFFSIDGFEPELVFYKGVTTHLENCSASTDGSTIVRGPADECFSFQIDGKPVLVVPRALALRATSIDRKRLVFTDATVFQDGSKLNLLSVDKTHVDVLIYPAAASLPSVAGAKTVKREAEVSAMSAFRVDFEPVTYSATFGRISNRRYKASFTSDLGQLNDVYMRINFVGDTGMAFIDGKMIDDHFYSGKPWDIGLKRFMPSLLKSEMVFVFHPIQRSSNCLKDVPAKFHPHFAEKEQQHLTVGDLEFFPEYKAVIKFDS